ncbi:hypothetical protein [Paenibacillus sp. Leaf72]|uniref:hypothetical protein n=1 Tax=Paenibacillus sp. Leaf72 TaxID=1736234 RepID=UPI0006F4453B|nr:hypothetical protein [Paenibacillus sp. Leaf72]KQN96884.1 hypothetical protein ASF12_22715 [Paenibacillus sp. Leaf72]
MKVFEYTNNYLIRYNERAAADSFLEVTADYRLINGRSTSLKVVVNAMTFQVVEILADIRLENEDVRDISEQQWIAGTGKEFLNVKVPTVHQYWVQGELTLLACFQEIENKPVSIQLRDHIEDVYNVSFKPNFQLLHEIKEKLKFFPHKRYDILFYTYKEFINKLENKSLKEKGTAYARAYQAWRTMAMACIAQGIPFNFIRGHAFYDRDSVFIEKDYFIEEIEIRKPAYMGSQFDDKQVILCTFHSHDLAQSENTDLALFSYINKGILERQWSVFINPGISFTPEIAPDIVPMLLKKYDKQCTEFRMLQSIQPIQASKESGYYLIPQVSNVV